MKLLFCPSCWDMRRISRYHEEPTVCSCGRGQAQRKEGGNECWWNGKGLILELADTDLAHLNLANEYDGLRGEDRIWLHKVADGKIEIRPQEEASMSDEEGRCLECP